MCKKWYADSEVANEYLTHWIVVLVAGRWEYLLCVEQNSCRWQVAVFDDLHLPQIRNNCAWLLSVPVGKGLQVILTTFSMSRVAQLVKVFHKDWEVANSNPLGAQRTTVSIASPFLPGDFLKFMLMPGENCFHLSQANQTLI